jgi:hypothetical protein
MAINCDINLWLGFSLNFNFVNNMLLIVLVSYKWLYKLSLKNETLHDLRF